MAYIPSHKGQAWLLPPNIEDMIPEDHICYLIEGLVESLDYTIFDIQYSGAGHPAYHPKILLKILIMGIIDKVRSSRRLAKNIRENIVYIYLSEMLIPDFRTISDFRKNNPELLKEVFTHTVSFAKEEGLLDLSYLCTDGSKIKANASNRAVMNKEELKTLLHFVEGELAEWEKQDAREDEKEEANQPTNINKRTIRKAAQYYITKLKEKDTDAINRLQQAMNEIETDKVKQVSITDPESRFMKTKGGRIELAYNCQVTTSKNGIILANDVCNESTDYKQLIPQIQQTQTHIGNLTKNTVWACDSGYFEGENINFLLDNNIDGYIPDNNSSKANNPYDKKNFTYNPERDEYLCPIGQTVEFAGEHYDRQKNKGVRLYKGQACLTCKEQRQCTKNKDGIRYLKMFPHEIQRYAMTAKMETNRAKELYRLRQQIVEPVFGDIKENKGMRGFLTRGIATVRGEFHLICTAVNIKRIWERLRNTFSDPDLLTSILLPCPINVPVSIPNK
jgi:transposase